LTSQARDAYFIKQRSTPTLEHPVMSFTTTLSTVNAALEQRAVKNAKTVNGVLVSLTQRTSGVAAKLPVVGTFAGQVGEQAQKALKHQKDLSVKAATAPYRQQARLLDVVSGLTPVRKPVAEVVDAPVQEDAARPTRRKTR
jgi:hypothetical protein